MKDEKHKQLEEDRLKFEKEYKNPTINEAFRYGWEMRELRDNKEIPISGVK